MGNSIFITSPDLDERSAECQFMTIEQFKNLSTINQETYVHLAADQDSPISDGLRTAIERVSITALLGTIENVQELNK